jgi:hypothetical protein
VINGRLNLTATHKEEENASVFSTVYFQKDRFVRSSKYPIVSLNNEL